MASLVPAVWAAIAASFSALTAFLMLLIQRRSFLESVRPELVLADWNHLSAGTGNSAHEVISMSLIRNVGRGAASNILMTATDNEGGRPLATMGLTRIPSILAPGEGNTVDAQIIIWWKNVAPNQQGDLYLPIHIVIYCWDARNRRHQTTYTLLASPLSAPNHFSDTIAPGLVLLRRTTSSRATWPITLRRHVWGQLNKASKYVLRRWY